MRTTENTGQVDIATKHFRRFLNEQRPHNECNLFCSQSFNSLRNVNKNKRLDGHTNCSSIEEPKSGRRCKFLYTNQPNLKNELKFYNWIFGQLLIVLSCLSHNQPMEKITENPGPCDNLWVVHQVSHWIELSVLG